MTGSETALNDRNKTRHLLLGRVDFCNERLCRLVDSLQLVLAQYTMLPCTSRKT